MKVYGITKRAIILIKKHEGCKLKAYKCPAGVWTIGYGHTGSGVLPGQVITTDNAEKLLIEDLSKFVDFINKLELSITENQFTALLSLVYNIGMGAFKASTLLKCIKANPTSSNIKYEWLRWTKANGRSLPGLTTRRTEEVTLYFTS